MIAVHISNNEYPWGEPVQKPWPTHPPLGRPAVVPPTYVRIPKPIRTFTPTAGKTLKQIEREVADIPFQDTHKGGTQSTQPAPEPIQEGSTTRQQDEGRSAGNQGRYQPPVQKSVFVNIEQPAPTPASKRKQPVRRMSDKESRVFVATSQRNADQWFACVSSMFEVG